MPRDESDNCPPNPIPLAETVEVLANAAAAEAPEDRPFIRYVSAGQYRTACGPPPTRAMVRARTAVDKLVNSLSTEPLPVPTRPLDPDALLLRIDLRAYGWARPIDVSGVSYRDGWEAIVAHSGLALEFVGGDADRLKQLVGTTIPWLLVGSFAAAASAGELYYALSAAPSTLGELKARLGIPPADDLAGGVWQRAGFSNSGASRQDRGVARYAGDAPGAALFWQTFDYAPATTLPGVFLEPIATRADAVEAIYSLPNGLAAYFIADGSGRRITESPFVVDPARGGAPRVMSSCGSCHNSGLIVFDDSVRAFVEANVDGSFAPEQVEAVRASYPPPDIMQAQLAEDSTRLIRALVQAGQPERSPDPVSRVALGYELVANLDVVATELYLSPDELDLGELPAPLRAIATGDGLSRATVEANYRDAMCRLHTGPIVPVGCP